MTETRSVTLWKLCRWAYQRQRVHVLLRKPVQWFQWLDAYAATDEDQARPTVHHDAAMLHAAVLDLGEVNASAIVWPAAEGQRPEFPDEAPKPYHVEVDRTHNENWAMIEGRRTYYAVQPFRYVRETRPKTKRQGRKIVVVGTETVDVPVQDYCPLRWEPDLAVYRASIGAYAAWSGAMAALTVTMAGVALRSHRLTSEAPPPPPPNPNMVADPWAAAQREHDPRQVDLTRAPSFGVDWSIDGPRIMERVIGAQVRR